MLPLTSLLPPQHRDATRRDIQGLRAIAVGLVVIYHASPQVPAPGGFVGVDVFFVISGFVITAMLLRELDRSGSLDLARFYRRRIARLLPAAALMTVITLALAVAFTSPLGPQRQTGEAAIAATLFSSNFYFAWTTGGYFQADAEANPFLHTWSLAVEEQFYLFMPLLFLIAWRVARKRGMVVVVAATSLISFALSIGLTYPAADASTRLGAVLAARGEALAFYLPVTRAWEFGAGAIIALIHPWLFRRVGRAATVALGTIGMFLIGTAAVLTPTQNFPGFWALLPVVGTVALIVGGIPPYSSPVSRWLGSKPLMWVGDRSYSFYLWHWPFIVFARQQSESAAVMLLAVGASVIVGHLAYTYVENPIHRSKRPWRGRRLATLWTACILPGLLVASVFLHGASIAWANPNVGKWKATIAEGHLDQTLDCSRWEPLGSSSRPAACVRSTPESGGRVLLLGDSHAGHLSEGVIAAAHSLGYDAELATFHGCPFLSPDAFTMPLCRNFVAQTQEDLLKDPDQYVAVIISNADSRYPAEMNSVGFRLGDALEKATADWVARSTDSIDQLVRGGVPVVVVGDVPPAPGMPTCLAPSIWRAPDPDCLSNHHADEEKVAVRDYIVDRVLAGATSVGATTIDTRTSLCDPEGACNVLGPEGLPLWRDEDHLSTVGSRMLEGALADAISTALERRTSRPSP